MHKQWIPGPCLGTRLLSMGKPQDHGNFLSKQHILPHFARGAKEVYLFDHQGRHPNSPKVFERARRRAQAESSHSWINFNEATPIPKRWQIHTMLGEQFHISLTRGCPPFLCVVSICIPWEHWNKKFTSLLTKELSPLWPSLCSHLHSTKRHRSHLHVQGSVKAEQVCLAGALSFSESSRSSHWHSPVTDQVLHCLWCLKELPSMPHRWRKPKLTTFITPFGQFKYLRGLYGISSISEHYRQMDKAFAGIQGIRKIVDNVVVFDEDEQHVEHACQRDLVPLWRERNFSEPCKLLPPGPLCRLHANSWRVPYQQWHDWCNHQFPNTQQLYWPSLLYLPDQPAHDMHLRACTSPNTTVAASEHTQWFPLDTRPRHSLPGG